MNPSIKKRFSLWPLLALSFLIGASAGSIGYSLGRGRCCASIESVLSLTSTMRPHATGHQVRFETESRLKREARAANRAIGQQLEALSIVFNCALFEANEDHSAQGIFRADDRQYRALVFEQIADVDLDISVGIAQRHLLPQSFQEKKQPDQRKHGAEQPAGNVPMWINWQHGSVHQGMHIVSEHGPVSEPDNDVENDDRGVISFHRQNVSRSDILSSRQNALIQRPSSTSRPGPSVLALRIMRSAPADPLLAGWRDRPYVLTDPSWYSEENVKTLLTNKPESVSKLLAALFRTNHLTRAERELLAADLDLIPTSSAQRIPQSGRQANGGSPKTKGAHA